MGRRRKLIDVEQVNRFADIVCSVTGVNKQDLCSKGRYGSIIPARFMLYYILYHYTDMGYYMIGKALNKNHGAVLHGVAIAQSWSEDTGFKDAYAVSCGKTLNQIIDKLKESSDDDSQEHSSQTSI